MSVKWEKISDKSVEQLAYKKTNETINNIKRFVRNNSVVSYKKQIGWGTTIQRFFENGGRECGNKNIDFVNSLGGYPYIDHYGIFKTKDNNVIVFSHSYSHNKAKAENVILNKLGPNFKITFKDNEGWYKPHNENLLLLLITLKNVYIK